MFRHCRFHEHFSFCADYVGCTFEGKIATAVFCGKDAAHSCGGKQNEFIGNDFREANLKSVAFRNGIDVRRQLWPQGYEPVVDVP